jgi:hypothetical protein
MRDAKIEVQFIVDDLKHKDNGEGSSWQKKEDRRVGRKKERTKKREKKFWFDEVDK